MTSFTKQTGSRSSPRGKWEKTRARRAAARERSQPKVRGTPRLLTGLIECGCCHRKIHYHRGHGTKHPDHYACVGAAGAAQYFHNPCKGGAVTARRAEELVVAAVMKSAPAVFRSEIAALYSKLRDERYWADATTAERQEILVTVIEKVVLIPRPDGTIRGRGQPRERELRLVWKSEFISEDGEQDSISELLRDPQSTGWQLTRQAFGFDDLIEHGDRRVVVEMKVPRQSTRFKGRFLQRVEEVRRAIQGFKGAVL